MAFATEEAVAWRWFVWDSLTLVVFVPSLLDSQGPAVPSTCLWLDRAVTVVTMVLGSVVRGFPGLHDSVCWHALFPEDAMLAGTLEVVGSAMAGFGNGFWWYGRYTGIVRGFWHSHDCPTHLCSGYSESLLELCVNSHV